MRTIAAGSESPRPRIAANSSRLGYAATTSTMLHRVYVFPVVFLYAPKVRAIWTIARSTQVFRVFFVGL